MLTLRSPGKLRPFEGIISSFSGTINASHRMIVRYDFGLFFLKLIICDADLLLPGSVGHP